MLYVFSHELKVSPAVCNPLEQAAPCSRSPAADALLRAGNFGEPGGSPDFLSLKQVILEPGHRALPCRCVALTCLRQRSCHAAMTAP